MLDDADPPPHLQETLLLVVFCNKKNDSDLNEQMRHEADHPPHPPQTLLLVVFRKKKARAKAIFYRGFIGSNFGIVSFLENVSIK